MVKEIGQPTRVSRMKLRSHSPATNRVLKTNKRKQDVLPITPDSSQSPRKIVKVSGATVAPGGQVNEERRVEARQDREKRPALEADQGTGSQAVNASQSVSRSRWAPESHSTPVTQATTRATASHCPPGTNTNTATQQTLAIHSASAELAHASDHISISNRTPAPDRASTSHVTSTSNRAPASNRTSASNRALLSRIVAAQRLPYRGDEPNYNAIHMGKPSQLPHLRLRGPGSRLLGQDAVFTLQDCRNERNGLSLTGSLEIRSRVAAPGTARKICGPCFKTRRITCDGGERCNHCTALSIDCTAGKIIATTTSGTEAPAAPAVPAMPRFEGHELWEKCRACAPFGIQCVFEGDSHNCKHCTSRNLPCRPQIERPKNRQPTQGKRGQTKEMKCRACFKGRSHCNGEKPRCGRCVKMNYTCIPSDTEIPPPVPKDNKCRRCRQLKDKCSVTLPCPRCVSMGISCGLTWKEEQAYREFYGVAPY